MNIKRISKHLLMMATMLFSLPLNIMAEEELPPLIIEFKTSVLELEEGEEGRTATILLGANKSETDYLLIDCGNGIEEHEFSFTSGSFFYTVNTGTANTAVIKNHEGTRLN